MTEPDACVKGFGEKEIPMLVLTRKKDQSIVIGDDIKITIVDIRGDKVRLGIEAPKTVPVHRQEVWIAIKNEIAAAEVSKQEP
jgi:carbon storage regulator